MGTKRLFHSRAVQGSFEPGILSEFVTTSADVKMPRAIYGNEFAEVTAFFLLSVAAGFRGFETVSQPMEGNYKGAPEGIQMLFGSREVTRDEVFIQSKINPELARTLAPYGTIKENVYLSVMTVLDNLKLNMLDSLILESPFPTHSQTMEAWKAMEDFVGSGMVRQIGIGNVSSLDELQRIYDDAAVKPAVVRQ